MAIFQLNAIQQFKNKGLTILVIPLLLLVLVLPFAVSDTLMFGTQTAKSIVFIYAMSAISILAIAAFLVNRKSIFINFILADFLILAFYAYSIAVNPWNELKNSLLFLENSGLVVLYLIVRTLSTKAHLWMLAAILIGASAQAIYGNLQLWGFYPSNHGMFKMTGSFFNPGPFAGYLAAAFPIALGYYLKSSTATPFEGSKTSSFDFLKKFEGFKTSSFEGLKKFEGLMATPFERLKQRSIKREASNSEASNLFSNSVASNNSILNSLSLLSFLSIIGIISILLVLPASRSRAAWLAVIGSSILLLSVHFGLPVKIRAYLNTTRKKVLAISGSLILIAGIAFGLYHFNKASSDGRLLIWKVSSEMIKDKPLFGHGFDGFKKQYMNYQADFFVKQPNSRFVKVAGDNTYTFNEFLKVTTESGFTGLLFVLLILGSGFTHWMKNRNTLRQNFEKDFKDHFAEIPNLIAPAVVLSILIFAFFSYPMQILPIKTALVVAFAIVPANTRFNVSEKPYPKRSRGSNVLLVLVGFACPGFTVLATNQLPPLQKAITQWKDATDYYQMEYYTESLEEFANAYPILQTNGDYLTNYGKALAMAEKPGDAVILLQQAACYYPNTIVYTALGDSYKQLKQNNEAEQAYLIACTMNPGRMYPKYLLAKLYNETGQTEKAKELANQLLEMEVKVESTAVEEIRQEMNMILNKQIINP